MATRITSANGVYDLSEVKTLKDLREEIGFIRTSLKKDEEELEARLYRIDYYTQLPFVSGREAPFRIAPHHQ